MRGVLNKRCLLTIFISRLQCSNFLVGFITHQTQPSSLHVLLPYSGWVSCSVCDAFIVRFLTFKTDGINGLTIYNTSLLSLVHFSLLFPLNLINIANIFSHIEQLQSLQGFDYSYDDH